MATSAYTSAVSKFPPRTRMLLDARYVGFAKTHLQHVLTATAINLARLAAWLAGEPQAQTRQSSFVRLVAQPV